MNQKFFKLFLLISLLSLFAVACSNKSTGPEKTEDTSKTITVAKILEVLKTVPKLEVGGETWDFSTITDLSQIPELTSTTSGSGATVAQVMQALTAGATPILEKNGIMASNPQVTGGDANTTNPLTVTLTVGLQDGYSADAEVQKLFANGLTIKFIPKANWK